MKEVHSLHQFRLPAFARAFRTGTWTLLAFKENNLSVALISHFAGHSAKAKAVQESGTERRLRESAVVDQKITQVYNIADIRHELDQVQPLE